MYRSLERIRELGGTWDGRRGCWVIGITWHPLNNRGKRHLLERMVDQLAKEGCKLVYERG